jgi:predicted permease
VGLFAVGVNLSAERREERAPLRERPSPRGALAVGLRLLTAPMILAGVSATVVRLPSSYLLLAAMPTGVNTLTSVTPTGTTSASSPPRSCGALPRLILGLVIAAV